MIIKRIKSIKNFGVFNNYRIGGNTRDFNERNIIYGWNYSGKTTLSRLFYFLNKEVEIPAENSSIEFEIELDNGQIITQENRVLSPLSIKVFNSDFVHDNLSFGRTDNRIKGITFDVGGNIETRNKIDKNNSAITKGISLIEKHNLNILKFNEFETRFTKEAGRIKNECFNSLIEFNKGHLKKIIDSLSLPLENYVSITPQDLEKIKATALTQTPKQEISLERAPILEFEYIYNEYKDILESEPIKTDDDSLLSNDIDLYDWAKIGYKIYKDKKTIQKCAFCGNLINKNRLNYLNKFYTNEGAKLRARIEKLSVKINNEIQVIAELEWSKKSINDLMENCQQEFSSLLVKYDKLKKDYISILNLLQHDLIIKSSNSLFIKQELSIIDSTCIKELRKWIIDMQNIFSVHNKTISDFKSIRDNARNTYKKYLVAQILIDENYYETKRLKQCEERFGTRCKNIINNIKTENQTLESQLKTITKGKEELNKFIHIFLNRNDISIEVTDNDYFILKRGGNIATNLSDGEKTAIAFSHFMVMLNSLQISNLKNTIIYIDDPISSLDANHIAQVSSLINSFFFRKEVEGNNPSKIISCFKQLFISTHSFEFYSFIKTANNIKRNKDGKCCNFFLLKRKSCTESILTDIPKELSNYNSEYIYLFSEIDKFKEAGFPEETSYIMPNVIRRFLEIYTLIKLPGNKDEIDNRVKILIGDVNELKILHTFSHFTSFERVTQHSALIFRLEDIISDLYILLNKDSTHLSSLYEGIGKRMSST